jgi:hypothetical protein
MCEPLTILAATAAVSSVAATGHTYAQTKKNAEHAQETITEQTLQNYKALAQKRLQEQTALAQEQQAVDRQVQLAKGSQRVSAGARGVVGKSVGSLLQNVAAQQARANAALKTRNKFQAQAAMNDLKSIELQGKSAMGSAVDPIFPAFQMIGQAAGGAAQAMYFHQNQ